MLSDSYYLHIFIYLLEKDPDLIQNRLFKVLMCDVRTVVFGIFGHPLLIDLAK